MEAISSHGTRSLNFLLLDITLGLSLIHHFPTTISSPQNILQHFATLGLSDEITRQADLHADTPRPKIEHVFQAHRPQWSCSL